MPEPQTLIGLLWFVANRIGRALQHYADVIKSEQNRHLSISAKRETPTHPLKRPIADRNPTDERTASSAVSEYPKSMLGAQQLPLLQSMMRERFAGSQSATDKEVGRPMIFHRSETLQILAAAFTLSSLAGLAATLRSEKELTPSDVVLPLLQSGLLGLGIAVVWFHFIADQESLLFLLGVSALAGIGGMTLLDAAVQATKHIISLKS